MPRDIIHHTYWTSVGFRCVLSSRRQDAHYLVQLFHGEQVKTTLPCRDADEGAAIAEDLWKEFVELA